MPAPASTTPGVGGVRKHFCHTIIGTADAFFPLSGPLVKGITLVKATITAYGPGSSPVSAWTLQSRVAGSAAVNLTAAITPASYGTTGLSVDTDMPFTTTALQNVAAGASLGYFFDYTSGTMPPTCICVEYFDDDGLNQT